MNTVKSGWEIKILAIIAVLAVITVSQPILFPLILSFFLYLLFNPILEGMVKIKLPKIAAAALIILGLLGLISLAITFLVQPAANWVEGAPRNFRIIEKKFTFVKKSLGKINKAAETAQNLTEVDKEDDDIKVVKESSNLGSSLFGLTSNILILISTVLIFLFFLLIYFKPYIQNLESAFYKRRKRLRENAFLVSLKNEVSKYLFTFSIICLGLGIFVAFFLWILGVPNAILWGGMATILTFIPYIGHLIGIIIISFVSLITFDSYFYIFAPPITYFLLTVLEGQIVTPIFLGNRLHLNPLIVFLSIFIWGWLWGISGIIISVPLLVTIKIVLEHIPSLSRYKLLLE